MSECAFEACPRVVMVEGEVPENADWTGNSLVGLPPKGPEAWSLGHVGVAFVHSLASAVLVLGLLVPPSVCGWSSSGSLRPRSFRSGCVPFDQNDVKSKLDRRLALGESVNQQMTGGEVHQFRVGLAKGQFLHVVVEQRGIDVSLRLLGPEGVLLIEMDSPNGMNGPESVSVIAPEPGEYILEVVSDRSALKGAYEINILELRQPTKADEARVAAERAFALGQKLRMQGTPESRQVAMKSYEGALASWRQIGDLHGQAYALCNLGRIYKAIGSLSEAVECLRKASELLRDAQDGLGAAFMLNELGSVHRDLGNPQIALECYEKALQLRRDAADRWGEAQILINKGLVLARTGFQNRAREAYTEALVLCRSLGDRNMEAIALNGLAGTLKELGDLSGALMYFQQVFQLARQNGNRNLEAYANNNLGLIYDTLADSDRGLSHYEAALSLFHDLRDQSGEALVLDNIGLLYAGIGDVLRAIDFFAKSLYIRDQLKEPRGKAITLTNLGYVSSLSGDQSKALHYFELAMPLTMDANDAKLRAYALLSGGMAYSAAGRPQQGLKYLVQALDIQKEQGDQRAQAITLDKMGEAYLALESATKSLSCHSQALNYWNALGDKQGLALSLYQTALANLRLDNLAESRDKIEEAIGIVEPLRGKMTSRQLRLIYFSSKYDFYALDIEVRMRLYERNRSEADVAAALFAAERARARTLLDQLELARTGSPRSVDPVLTSGLRHIEAEISSRAESLMRLRALGRTEDAAVVEKRLESLNYEYDHLEAEINRKGRPYPFQSSPHLLTVSETQAQLLDGNTLLLEYVLGEQRSYLWVMTKSTLEAFILPPRSEIEHTANELRVIMLAAEPRKPGESGSEYATRKRQGEKYWQKATAFSEVLLRPAAPWLKDKRIVVVADGALRVFPFGLLPEPQNGRQESETAGVVEAKTEPLPLILKHEIVYLPSCSVLALLRERTRSPFKAVAVFADPVFDTEDPRVSDTTTRTAASSSQAQELTRALQDVGLGNSGFRLQRLPFSIEEARAISALTPPLSTMEAIGFDANKVAAMSGELGQYKIVHFATHGILNDSHPELSGIVLSLINERGESRDGFLRLNDIYNLTLPVDLVVLSACQTGMGREVKGEGLIGLTHGFMNAGAARIIASLWKVDDEATAELMKRLYQHMLTDGMSACSALRAAQIDMSKGNRRWRAPYYWAAFVLQGDWR